MLRLAKNSWRFSLHPCRQGTKVREGRGREGFCIHISRFPPPPPPTPSFLQPSKRHNKHLIHGCCPCLLLLLPLLLLQHFGGGEEEEVAKVAFLHAVAHAKRMVNIGGGFYGASSPFQEQNVAGVSCLRNTSRPRGKFRDTARTVYCIIL